MTLEYYIKVIMWNVRQTENTIELFGNVLSMLFV